MMCLAQVEFIAPLDKQKTVKWSSTYESNCLCCGRHIMGNNVSEKGNWAYCDKCLDCRGRCCKK